MATRPVVTPGTLYEMLERGRRLHGVGNDQREIGQALGISASTWQALLTVAKAADDDDPKIAEAGKLELERINDSGSVGPSYERVMAVRKGTRVRPPARRARYINARIVDVVPAAFDTLRGLILGFETLTVEQLATVHAETLLEWADQMGRFRSQLYGFQKKAKAAATHE